jgi:hypothetical protein
LPNGVRQIDLIETPIFDGQFSTKKAADAFREQFKPNVPLGRKQQMRGCH